MPVMISTELQVLSSSALTDLLAEESGPLLPSVLPAPEVTKWWQNNDNTTLMITRQRLQEQIQTYQGREALPIPMALASPERSSVDEQSFKVFQFLDCLEFTRTIFCLHLFQMKTVFKLFYISDGDQLSKSPICNAPPHSKHFNAYIMENELNYKPIWH